MDSSESSFPQTSVFLSDQSPSLDTASDSDNDGFVSGEEGDFEPESTRPVLVKTSAPVEEPQLDGPLHEAHRPIAKVTKDDDGSVEDADDVAEGDADGVVWHNSGEREESGEAVKDGDFSDSNEVFVEASGDDDREGAVENGVDADKGFEGDGVELDEREEEEKAVEEVHDGGTNHLDSVVDEKGEDEGGVVEKDFVDGVEAVVDSVESSLLGTGVVDDLDVQEPHIKGLHEAARVSLDNGFDAIDKVGDDDDNNDGDVIVGGGDEYVVQNVDGPDGVIGGDDGPGENGVSGDGLKSDIVVPREEGGGSEFVEQNEVTKEGDVEGEIENHVEEKGDDEVERGHHGDREIDGLVSDEKIGSSDYSVPHQTILTPLETI